MLSPVKLFIFEAGPIKREYIRASVSVIADNAAQARSMAEKAIKRQDLKLLYPLNPEVRDAYVPYISESGID